MEQKISILFVVDALREGGISISLLNLLNNLNYNKYDITLFCFHLLDKDKDKINKHVKLIYPNKLFNLVASTGIELKKQKNYFKFLIRLILSVLCKVINSNVIYNFIFKTEKRHFNYDIAISFTNNVGDHSLYFGCNKFVNEKVVAKKKIAWIHADYEIMGLNSEINNKEYSVFDEIVCVSKGVAQSFLKFNKQLSDKTTVVYNCMDIDKMEKLSKINLNEKVDTNILNILSVIRLDENKDPMFMLKVAKELKKQGTRFIWRIVGDGPLYEKVSSCIKTYKIEDCVKMYGYTDNPYKYYKISDMYISASNSEGYGLSILEALYFRLIVISSRFKAVYEVLDNKNGIIVEKEVSEFVEVINKSKFKDRNSSYIIHTNEAILEDIDNLFRV